MLTIVGCNTLKNVGDNELLLTENSLHVDNEEITDKAIQNLIFQKPNSHVLGYPLRLHIYNMATKPPDSSSQEGLHSKEKHEKQSRGFFLVRGIRKFLKQTGEAPVIIDTALARKSVDRLEAYYGTKGYFNNSGTYTLVKDQKENRAKVNYEIFLRKPYFIDTLTKNIRALALDSLYNSTVNLSLVKEGDQFDLTKFTLERKRLTALFRNSGIYNFQESSISYDILRDTTQAANDQGMKVELNIQNPRSVNDTSAARTPYKIHRFKKINIYTDYEIDGTTDSLQSLEYKNYTLFYNHKLRYKPKALTDAIFFHKDSVYREVDRLHTYRQITNLNTFKYPNIELIPDTTQALLTSNIYLTSKPKYSLNLNFDVTHSNIQQVGTTFGITAVTRNVFGGAETLNVSARGSVGLLSDASLSNKTFTSELGGDINITFPRIWFLLNTTKIIPNYMLPQSRLLVGTNFQKNIGLDKQSFNTVLSYTWSPNTHLTHNLELLNVEFVRNVNPDNFYNVYQNTYSRLNNIADGFEDDVDFAGFYDENLNLLIPQGTDAFIAAVTAPGFQVSADTLALVKSIEERQQRLTENNLIVTTNYTYTKNNKTAISDIDFYQYRIKLEGAGNLLALLNNVVPYKKNTNEQLLVFGIPFSQYIKTEFDFIRHWKVGTSGVIAYRNFLGLAVPYGNSNNIPFVRSYFAGGSNDNRGWNAYELGPGRTDNLNDFNEANLKLAFNLEYRFPIAGKVKGALFADAGNIWNVFDNEDNPDAIFNGFGSLADIALGTGLGLRYDFTYFVFRFDVGFKTYNPAEEPAQRWFREYNFKNAVLNIGINYPF